MNDVMSKIENKYIMDGKLGNNLLPLLNLNQEVKK